MNKDNIDRNYCQGPASVATATRPTCICVPGKTTPCYQHGASVTTTTQSLKNNFLVRLGTMHGSWVMPVFILASTVPGGCTTEQHLDEDHINVFVLQFKKDHGLVFTQPSSLRSTFRLCSASSKDPSRSIFEVIDNAIAIR